MLSSEYTPSALDYAFETIPQLSKLVDGLKHVQSNDLDKVDLSKTTFVAQVTGHSTHPPNGLIGPIFNQDEHATKTCLHLRGPCC